MKKIVLVLVSMFAFGSFAFAANQAPNTDGATSTVQVPADEAPPTAKKAVKKHVMNTKKKTKAKIKKAKKAVTEKAPADLQDEEIGHEAD